MIDVPMTSKTKSRTLPVPVYELRIELENIEPRIWRRVLVSGNISLGKLHQVIQAAMGWDASHLHEVISDPEFELEKRQRSRSHALAHRGSPDEKLFGLCVRLWRRLGTPDLRRDDHPG
jgi:hypothetical protein